MWAVLCGPERRAVRLALVIAFLDQGMASTAIVNYAPQVPHVTPLCLPSKFLASTRHQGICIRWRAGATELSGHFSALFGPGQSWWQWEHVAAVFGMQSTTFLSPYALPCKHVLGCCAQVLERLGVQGHGLATALSACIPASKVRRSGTPAASLTLAMVTQISSPSAANCDLVTGKIYQQLQLHQSVCINKNLDR